MDLERIDSAIEGAWKCWNNQRPVDAITVSKLIDAARAYRDLLANFPTDEDVEVAIEAIGERLTLAALPGRGVLREAARAALQAVADARRTEEEM